jgi:hypothetical protein
MRASSHVLTRSARPPRRTTKRRKATRGEGESGSRPSRSAEKARSGARASAHAARLQAARNGVLAQGRAAPSTGTLTSISTSSQLPRWDVPSTPRRQHRPLAAQSPSPNHQKRPVPGSSKAHTRRCPVSSTTLLYRLRKRPRGQPGLMPRKVRGYASGIWDHRCAHRSTSIWTDTIVRSGRPSEVDFHMDLGDDVRAPQPQHVASSSTAKPFDWLGWVGFLLVCFVPQRSGHLCIDETTGPCAFDVANCPKYDSTPVHSATFDANHATTFSLACTSLMDAVAASAGSYDPIARVVVDSLAQIVNILLIGVQVSQGSSSSAPIA